MLDNAPNQPSKFRRKNCVEIDDDTCGTYNTNSQIKFKTPMLESSLCDYSDAYILAKGTISIAPDVGANPNNSNKEIVFKILCSIYWLHKWNKQYTNRSC